MEEDFLEELIRKKEETEDPKRREELTRMIWKVRNTRSLRQQTAKERNQRKKAERTRLFLEGLA